MTPDPDPESLSAEEKTELVLRVLRGEHIPDRFPDRSKNLKMREQIARWVSSFVAAGRIALKTRTEEWRVSWFSAFVQRLRREKNIDDDAWEDAEQTGRHTWLKAFLPAYWTSVFTRLRQRIEQQALNQTIPEILGIDAEMESILKSIREERRKGPPASSIARLWRDWPEVEVRARHEAMMVALRATMNAMGRSCRGTELYTEPEQEEFKKLFDYWIMEEGEKSLRLFDEWSVFLLGALEINRAAYQLSEESESETLYARTWRLVTRLNTTERNELTKAISQVYPKRTR